MALGAHLRGYGVQGESDINGFQIMMRLMAKRAATLVEHNALAGKKHCYLAFDASDFRMRYAHCQRVGPLGTIKLAWYRGRCEASYDDNICPETQLRLLATQSHCKACADLATPLAKLASVCLA